MSPRFAPGTPIDIPRAMAIAVEIQNEMAAAQKQLEGEVVEAESGGGIVKVKLGGDLMVREVTIDPAAFTDRDPELLGEMVLVAVNEAVRSVQELTAELLGGVDRGGVATDGGPRSG